MALLKALFYTVCLFTPPWGWAVLVFWFLYWYFKGVETPDYSGATPEPEWESAPLPEGSEIGSKVH